MYDYMKGLVTDIRPEGITLEVNNIGYFINVANPYTFEINKRSVRYRRKRGIKKYENKKRKEFDFRRKRFILKTYKC